MTRMMPMMKLLSNVALASWCLPLLVSLSTTTICCNAQQPLIYDTDHGPFIDDIFALGLLLNSQDLIDMQLIMGTSEQPDLSAICIAAQMNMSDMQGIPIAMGEQLPPYEERGSVCGIPGILGFGIEPACRAVYNDTESAGIIEDGVAYAAQLLLDSGRDDWWYLVVGGQTSLLRLIQEFPEAASKINTLIVMAGNWCSGFEPYPDVMAPTDETNIGCDPKAANAVLDGNTMIFPNVYYVPVEVADEIGGDDYTIFVDAANSGEQPIARATLDFYKYWSEASRADPNLLVHAEAMTYDPETESTPQFDAMAVMLMLELLSQESCGPEGRIFKQQFEAVHFLENDDEGLEPFPDSPRSSFSLYAGFVDTAILPEQCPNMTEFTFDPEETSEMEYPIMAALGYLTAEGKAAVYQDLARRLAGEYTLCGFDSTMGSNETKVPTMAPSIPTSETTPEVPTMAPSIPTSETTPGDAGEIAFRPWVMPFTLIVSVILSMLSM